MTMQSKIEYTCPHCGKQVSFNAFDSVNAQLNPEEAEKLKKGTLFLQTCPECGEKTPVFYPCLYHDMDHAVMVQYTHLAEGEDPRAKADAFLDGLQKAVHGAKLPKERLRMVFTPYAFQEKAIIFGAGFDDRLIEIYKAFVFNHVVGKRPELKTSVSECLFNLSGEDLGFLFYDEKGKLLEKATLPRAAYADLEKTVTLPADDDPLVGPLWVQNFFAREANAGRA